MGFDLLTPTVQQRVEENIFYYHPESYGFFDEVFGPDYALRSQDILWSRIHCYESKINPLEDEVEPNTPDSNNDTELLKLFKDIINYSLTPAGKRRCSSSSSKLLNLARNTGQKLLTRRKRTLSV